MACATEDDPPLVVRRLGRADFQATWQAMRTFTARRTTETADELWLCEHAPIYTLGLAGRREHLLRATDIPVLHIDRGGQITYHGPGQIVVYLLLDLKRRSLTVKGLVQRLEQALIDLLADYHIAAERRPGAPGVYVAGAKIAALGLKITHGCCYHGLALNVAMDLAPFAAIDPCGYPGLAVTHMAAFVPHVAPESVAEALVEHLRRHLAMKRQRHHGTE